MSIVDVDKSMDEIFKLARTAENGLEALSEYAHKLNLTSDQIKDELEELKDWIREVANYIETDDTTQIFSGFGADGEPEWNKEYIVFRLRDMLGECYTDERGKKR
jgi:hypothetical protein